MAVNDTCTWSDINKPELGYTGIQPWFVFFFLVRYIRRSSCPQEISQRRNAVKRVRSLGAFLLPDPDRKLKKNLRCSPSDMLKLICCQKYKCSIHLPANYLLKCKTPNFHCISFDCFYNNQRKERGGERMNEKWKLVLFYIISSICSIKIWNV